MSELQPACYAVPKSVEYLRSRYQQTGDNEIVGASVAQVVAGDEPLYFLTPEDVAAVNAARKEKAK